VVGSTAVIATTPVAKWPRTARNRAESKSGVSAGARAVRQAANALLVMAAAFPFAQALAWYEARCEDVPCQGGAGGRQVYAAAR